MTDDVWLTTLAARAAGALDNLADIAARHRAARIGGTSTALLLVELDNERGRATRLLAAAIEHARRRYDNGGRYVLLLLGIESDRVVALLRHRAEEERANG